MKRNILYLLAALLLVGCSHQPQTLNLNEQKMQALYSTLDYTELTTCGHFIHMEQAEMFNTKSKTFLETRTH